MLRIDVNFAGIDTTFRTNNDGSYLFVGDSNRQISTLSGYNKTSQIKRDIKHYLRSKWWFDHNSPENLMYPRIKYTYISEGFK